MSRPMPKTLAAAVLVLVALSPVAGQQKRVITETDIMKFVWIAEGADLARRQAGGLHARRRSTRRRTTTRPPVDGAGRRRRAAAPADRRARATAARAGRRTARRSRSCARSEKDGKPQPPQIYPLPLDGGEARPITDLPRGASGAGVVARRHAHRLQQHDAPDERLSCRRPRRRATCASSRARCIAPTAAAGTIPIVRRTSGSPTCTLTGAAVREATQLTTGKYRRERSCVVAGWEPRLLHVGSACDEAYSSRAIPISIAVPARGGEISKVASINGTHRRSATVARRQVDRLQRHALRHAGALVRPAGPVRRAGGRQRRAAQPDRRATTSTSAAASAAISARRAAAAPAARSGRPTASRSSSSPANRARPTWFASTSRPATSRRSTRRRTPCRPTPRTPTAATIVAVTSTRHQHQRPVRARPGGGHVEREADHARQRRAVQDHQAERARGESRGPVSTARRSRAGCCIRPTSTSRSSIR